MRRLLWLVGVLIAGLWLGGTAAAQGRVVRACVNNSGQIRTVTATQRCFASEQQVLRRLSGGMEFGSRIVFTSVSAPRADAGPAGAEVIETDSPGSLTAIGRGALFSNTTGYANTASGFTALFNNTDGFENTASGSLALYSNTTGSRNTAIGFRALYFNTAGSLEHESSSNTAIGAYALHDNTTGHFNTASGVGALSGNTEGYENTAIGIYALGSNTTGHYNVAIGSTAMRRLDGGSNNIAIGKDAGSQAMTGWWNIWVGNVGTSSDGGVIRIGTAGYQSKTWIAGIVGSPLSADAAVVGIQPDGRVGTLAPELLPVGPQGPRGLPGPEGPKGDTGAAGPAGLGLVPGSLLFLPSTITPPTGYVLLGSTDLVLAAVEHGKPLKLAINVYQMR
jgi:hypothetical protein